MAKYTKIKPEDVEYEKVRPEDVEYEEAAASSEPISPVTGKPYTPEQLGWGTGYAPNLQAEDVGLEIAKAIGVEKAYLGDTSFFGGAPVVMSPQDKQALLTLVNMPPEKREEAASAFLSVYNPGGGERGQYTLARATKRAEDDFLKRAQALGFSPDNLPKDPGVYKTALGSLGQAVTLGSMDYLLSKMAPSLADVKEAVQTGQPSLGVQFSDVLTRLKDYNPALYARIEQGDNTLTEEEYRQGVQDAVNTEARAGALRSPGASLLGETAGVATGEGLAAKTFGKAFTTPLVQATKEGVRGYNLGETPMQSLGGAVLGAAGGAAGAKLGEKVGTKVGGPQLKGAKDVLARQAAQGKIDEMLAPLLGMSKEEFVASQTKAQRELLAKAIKELRAEKKTQASSFAKFVEAEDKHKTEMLKFEQRVKEAADDYARGKLGIDDYEKIIAKEREAAYQQAKNFSEGKVAKIVSDVEKVQLKANEAAAKVEKVMRSEAGMVGQLSRQQLEAMDRARPQLMKQIEEQVLTPDEQLTLMDLDLRRGEIGREALAMKPKEQAKKLYEPLLENAKAEAEFYKQKVEEATQKAATPPTTPEVDVDLFKKLFEERVENRKRAGFVPRSPEVLQEEARRAMSLAPGGEAPALYAQYGLGPEAERLSQLGRALQEKRVPAPTPMSRQEMIASAESKLTEPAYREALLAESPKQRAALEASFVPPTEAELAAKLPKGVTVPQAEKPYGRVGAKVPFLPASVSFGEAKPALSSVEVSPYAKYTQQAVKRSAAEEAMQTPVAVPALQAALTTTARDVTKPLVGRQSDIATLMSWLAPEETEQAEQTFEEAKQKIKTYYDALRK